ncbi:TIR domain-containing protein [Paraburkholderia acidipaludis]|uniref:TIR domain-containing protein n=1 Tax=Paraburkholderia acidipaludis TaxID=660537 RepID=UPI00146F97C1|nr:nucleotide-binding protein [Paraburkholderia acidipaludis]
MKPRLFIGSSSESLGLAYAVHENLKRDAECTPWSEGVFEPNKYTLESIFQALDKSDFGLFVFAADDVVRMRSVDYVAVRDNVLFELGMFVGRLGRERTFFLLPENQRDFRLPSDLLGLTPLIYESERQDQNWTAAVGPACHQIRLAMKRLPNGDTNSGVTSADASSPLSLGDEARRAIQIHTFSGTDKKLQESRIELATTIASVAARGISLADAETIWALGNNMHNEALRYKGRPDLAPLHIEEADAFNRFLSGKILSASKDEGKSKAIHYLGVHHHNMVSMISHNARLHSKDV